MKNYRLKKAKRFFMIYLITIIGFISLVVKLSYVKIVNGQNYYELALDLWTREAPVNGSRGNIYDRNGNLIVGTYLTPTLITIPKQVEDKESTAKKLANILNVDEKAILKHLNKKVSVEIIKPEGRYISVDAATRPSPSCREECGNSRLGSYPNNLGDRFLPDNSLLRALPLPLTVLGS